MSSAEQKMFEWLEKNYDIVHGTKRILVAMFRY